MVVAARAGAVGWWVRMVRIYAGKLLGSAPRARTRACVCTCVCMAECGIMRTIGLTFPRSALHPPRWAPLPPPCSFFPTWARLGPWQLVFWTTYEQLRTSFGMASF